MNKLLKKIITFAFLIFINMQIFGQGGWDPNPFDVYWFTDMVHSLEWLNQHPWFEPPSSGSGGEKTHTLNLMTYNLWRGSARWGEHKNVINGSGAQVVALQEMLGSNRFKRIKKKTHMNGSFLITDDCANWLFQDYGIALLWNDLITSPTITHRITSQSPYIIEVFTNYCVVCVHYPLTEANQTFMSNTILTDPVIVACQNNNRPIFIAGDFNCSPWANKEPIKAFTDVGYEVLNFMGTYEDPPNSGNYKWDHATKKNGTMIDLILEYSTKSNKTTLWKGIPSSFPSNWLGKCDCCECDLCPCHDHVSDHYPYLVKRRWRLNY
ncbi:MAG: endonuclease/exonuclease/phosphatase family protein [Marinilabiliaceae bacterium]|nr:endonuclease/exonuclease/phosphatase family protein [Marinilabiliaceae bacterium]